MPRYDLLCVKDQQWVSVIDEWARPVVPEGPSVAAAIDGWPVVPIGLVVTSELGALLLPVVSKGPSVASVLDE